MSALSEQHHPRPESLTYLFLSFSLFALQGFGGMLMVMQHELVDNKRWLTKEEFLENWSVSQIIPGSNVINLAIIVGMRYFGLRGALAALSGMLAAPLAIVLLLAFAYAEHVDDAAVVGALRGTGAVTAGLIASNGLNLVSVLKTHPLGLWLCSALAACCFLAVALLRWPLVYPLVALGSLSYALCYRKLRP